MTHPRDMSMTLAQSADAGSSWYNSREKKTSLFSGGKEKERERDRKSHEANSFSPLQSPFFLLSQKEKNILEWNSIREFNKDDKQCIDSGRRRSRAPDCF